MNTTSKRCGRFALTQTEKGLCWRLTTRLGQQWFWHPDLQLWTSICQYLPSEEDATRGLDWTVSHEAPLGDDRLINGA
jgi:hypothetical protein